ncbi:MAG TPA: C1 family peptidase [Candidatus Thermoplasmatota archaeon]|nr:C1 family peptidase [Candidatus Thermoplasmatota archaeon]
MKKIIITLLILFTFIINISLSIPIAQKSNNLPSSFSWRNINGVDYTTPMKDQSPAPTCEAYALCAALETIMQYETGELFQPDLSETHLYFYAGGTYEQGGVNVHDAADYLVEHGVPDERCYPDPHRPFDYPYTSVEGWENRTVKITEWGWVPHNQESIKEALIEYGPLTICIYVYDDMYDYNGGIYRRSTDEIVGGHLVALMGYNDTTQSWLVKNSWGSQWGNDGWFHMGYDPEMFIDGCYGGDTGIIYVDGVYGNYKPEVPKITIQQPTIFHSYLFNYELPQIVRGIPGIQKAAPRIIGPIDITVTAENTEKIEFYVDDKLKITDESVPFEWKATLPKGLHTVEIIAYDADGEISKDIVDVFVIL